jgi:predicted nucleic acid-binding protein
MNAYIDSDVLIWFLRGKKEALVFFNKIAKQSQYELWIGAVQRVEIAFFMRREEEEQTTNFLSRFKTSIIDEFTVDKASEIYRKWNPSNGVDINDSILAATAIINKGIIFTLNTKHYPMEDVIVEKAWE